MAQRHHIARRESGRCWLVTLRRSPRRFRWSFHDRRYGSKAAALAAAVAYRDQLLASMPDWRIHHQASSRNRSGVIGAFLAEQRKNGRVHRYWIALWKEKGRLCRRAFSVRRHGQRGARSLAVALRNEKVANARPDPPSLLRKPLSNTGILGVCRRVIRGTPVYAASWREDGKQRERAFSASRYGNARALALAIKERRRRVGVA